LGIALTALCITPSFSELAGLALDPKPCTHCSWSRGWTRHSATIACQNAKCFRRRSRLAAYFVVIARADLCPCSCQQAKMKDFEFPIGELPFFASLLASPPITKVVSAGFHFRYYTILFFGNSTPPDCARSSLTILVRPVTPILDIRRNCMDEYKVT
jgi:hypothetical protein